MPPSIVPFCCNLNANVHAFESGTIDAFVVTLFKCIVPSGKTRLSRLMLSGSPGRFGTSTIVPTPL
jgi:hypothetical protein